MNQHQQMSKPSLSGSESAKFPAEKTPLWEDAVVIVSIIVLWPAVLRRETIFSRIAMLVSLILLVVILFRRLKRLHRLAGHEH
ncbi:MAG TPA: hypothetical protein PKX93_03010 [bacterium]|nr:hypothetical protein [bacterium]HOL66411.1 hypothetical protein [bacterium]HPP11243.1 hypothetical protein [bacterium]